MWILQFLFFILFSVIAPQAMSNINNYFEAIKSDPVSLYAFFKQMPKGGELHYHLAGGAYAEVLFKLSAKGDYCLNPQTYALTDPPCNTIKSAQLSSKTALYQQVMKAWSMSDRAFGKKSDHDHFFATFLKFMPIVRDDHPQILADIMKRAAEQHELYLEIQISPDNAESTTFGSSPKGPIIYANELPRLLANKKFQQNLRHTITESSRILQQARRSLGCDQSPQQEVCQLTVKFQYFILREQPITQVFAQALNGFAAASQSKDIVGVNLVQAEDGVISMRDYQQQMQVFNYLHRIYPMVNIALHAGELTPGDHLSAAHSTHIHDAIFTGHAKRIGHGVNIIEEATGNNLLEHMAKIPIPVEINLTSNRKILGVAGKKHPLHHYVSNHVPIILSTDDEGILRTDLTHEYVDAVISHHLDYATIQNINRNALTYSFLPGKSLWANAATNLPVPECQIFNSLNCHHFINKSQKAKLQWRLEQKIDAFESRYKAN